MGQEEGVGGGVKGGGGEGEGRGITPLGPKGTHRESCFLLRETEMYWDLSLLKIQLTSLLLPNMSSLSPLPSFVEFSSIALSSALEKVTVK